MGDELNMEQMAKDLARELVMESNKRIKDDDVSNPIQKALYEHYSAKADEASRDMRFVKEARERLARNPPKHQSYTTDLYESAHGNIALPKGTMCLYTDGIDKYYLFPDHTWALEEVIDHWAEVLWSEGVSFRNKTVYIVRQDALAIMNETN